MALDARSTVRLAADEAIRLFSPSIDVRCASGKAESVMSRDLDSAVHRYSQGIAALSAGTFQSELASTHPRELSVLFCCRVAASDLVLPAGIGKSVRIRRGSILAVCPFLSHRDPQMFPDAPGAFR